MVTPRGVITPGWLRVDGPSITEVGSGRPPGPEPVDQVAGDWVFPGFIDLHVHGGGGGDFASGDVSQALRAVAFHGAHGTTRQVASLVSRPLSEMALATRALAALVRSGQLAGVHLEGPFLSPTCCGAHDPAHLRTPEPSDVETLLAAGGGAIASVTVAPELSGAPDALRRIVASGATGALGHTDATYAQACQGIEAGARLATHLFNAMRPWHHRQPGVAGAVMDSPEVVCELINDGVHLHDAVVRSAFTALGPGRVALVTDAIAATGLGDGDHRLGERAVEVRSGVARLRAGGALAGSTLTMDRSVRRAILTLRLAPEVVADAAATTPARVLGLSDVTGSLQPGLAADLVVLDDELQVLRVMRAGRWV